MSCVGVKRGREEEFVHVRRAEPTPTQLVAQEYARIAVLARRSDARTAAAELVLKQPLAHTKAVSQRLKLEVVQMTQGGDGAVVVVGTDGTTEHVVVLDNAGATHAGMRWRYKFKTIFEKDGGGRTDEVVVRGGDTQ